MENGRKNKPSHNGGYVAGWINSSIGASLEAFPLNAKGLAYALITCLDSNPAPMSLLKKNAALKHALNGVRPLGRGLLVPSEPLRKSSIRQQLFVGFDEVWFFPTDNITPKPESQSIVGPNRIEQAKLDELEQWMVKNSCSLALGDGAGLNFLIKAHGLVKSLLAQTMIQPEASFPMDHLWVQDEEKKLSSGKTSKYRIIDHA